MKYRDAKKLIPDDTVIRKTDNTVLTVIDIEVYGQYNKVRINCKEPTGSKVSVYQDEVN